MKMVKRESKSQDESQSLNVSTPPSRRIELYLAPSNFPSLTDLRPKSFARQESLPDLLLNASLSFLTSRPDL